MGSNLLLAYLPAAKITETRRKALHHLVDKLSNADANCDEITSIVGDSEVRPILHEHVDRLPTNPWEHRDAVEMAFPHMPYPLLITGGSSWGDSPTELFDPFCCLGVLPTIFRQLRRWAIDDEKRRNRGLSGRQHGS